MKVAASFAIASLVSDSELNADYILPEAFDKRIGKTVAEAVKKPLSKQALQESDIFKYFIILRGCRKTVLCI